MRYSPADDEQQIHAGAGDDPVGKEAGSERVAGDKAGDDGAVGKGNDTEGIKMVSTLEANVFALFLISQVVSHYMFCTAIEIP